MNKLVYYGIVCEDLAHKTFIYHYLASCFPETFSENEEFGWRIRATNAKEVDDSIIDAARQGFTKYSLDMLIIGRDADTTDAGRIKVLRDVHEGSCGPYLRSVVFMVPVQCIEHWLLYIKKHRDRPEVTKNESLESVRRIECKRLVYGDIKKAVRQAEIANTILADFDADWLEQRSESFKQFHNQVKNFLTSFSQ